MVTASKPPQALLFAGILYNPTSYSEDEFLPELERNFGEIEVISEEISFTFTEYYFKEMGHPLIRRWVGFSKLISPGNSYKEKLISNRMEKDLADSKGNRQVNIDPGYIDSSKVILLSCKDYSHRIYLRKGVYAEVEYLYEQGEYHHLDWTYPDYKTETALTFFKQIRKVYQQKKKK